MGDKKSSMRKLWLSIALACVALSISAQHYSPVPINIPHGPEAASALARTSTGTVLISSHDPWPPKYILYRGPTEPVVVLQPPADWSQCYASAMNDAAITVGHCYDKIGKFRSVKWGSDGVPTVIEQTRMTLSRADDINARGDILVNQIVDGGWYAIVVDGITGEVRRPGDGSLRYTWGAGLNDFGDVVGSESGGSPYGYRNVLWRANGEVVDLGTTFGPTDVNNRLEVVGWQHDMWNDDAFTFLWKDGTAFPLPHPDRWTLPTAFDDQGTVAITYLDSEGFSLAGVWNDADGLTLLGSGYINSITPTGDLVGETMDSQHRGRATVFERRK